MVKIAILNCLKSNVCCTGAACLKAYNEKTAYFSRYNDENTTLVAFAQCNGCKQNLDNDEGLKEKVERIKQLNPDVLHLGICTKKAEQECPTITDIANVLQASGIKIVRGCHA